jgi:glycosyltransferase involved in cell wall biosynthesis
MKVSGFTFIRNAIVYDYPIVEAIESILPLCDEVIVAVGKSDDGTLALIQKIAPHKIKIIETVWDDSLREGGKVLAVETDKALAAVAQDSDWCIYIQGDEVLHEDGYDEIKSAMLQFKDRVDIDGLLLKYRHFYGSYDYVGASSKWYRNEIRIIRNSGQIRSFKDAQGFRKLDNSKLKVIALKAYMHHYGWVKDPRAMQKKQESFNKLWHDDEWMDKNIIKSETFDYGREVKELSKYKGRHPQCMQARIARTNWSFETDISINRLTFKDKIKNWCYNQLGIELGYKNYRF